MDDQTEISPVQMGKLINEVQHLDKHIRELTAEMRTRNDKQDGRIEELESTVNRWKGVIVGASFVITGCSATLALYLQYF